MTSGSTKSHKYTLTMSELAAALHGDVSGNWINIRGPGHHAKDRSLGFRFDTSAPDGFWIKSFAVDDPIVCRSYVKGLLANVTAGGTITIDNGSNTYSDNDQQKIDWGMKLFDNAEPIKGTIAETYLSSRGIVLSPSVLTTGALRFHPFTRFGKFV